NNTFTTSALRAVIGDGGALDEAVMRDGDDTALVGDEVLHPHFTIGGEELSLAGVVETLTVLKQLFLNNAKEDGFLRQNGFELLYNKKQLGTLFLDFLALQTCELIEAKVEDVIGLALVDGVLGHEA